MAGLRTITTIATKKMMRRAAAPRASVFRRTPCPERYSKNPLGGFPRVEFSTASGPSASSEPGVKRPLTVGDDASAENPSGGRIPPASTLVEVREQLVKSALQQVHAHGWTRTAIIEAAALMQEGHGGRWSLSVAGMIEEPEDLIFEQMRIWRERLERDLGAGCEEDEPVSAGRRAERAIRTRLGYMRPFLESGTWSAAMAMGAHPLHAAETASQLSDLLAVVAGHCLPPGTDTGSLTFQTQQASLGAIYVATELHILTDSYPYLDSWDFLHQRIAEWEALWGGSGAEGSTPSLSPSDALSIAWTVSAAVASGIHSVLLPQAAAAAAAGAGSPAALLQQLKLPKELPVLPVLGPPPAPLSQLWTAVFDDDSSPPPSAPWGTLPSHYEAPPRPSR